MMSARPNLSPTAYKSGPALEPLPSTVWHLAQASFCSSLKKAAPRVASPSCVSA